MNFEFDNNRPIFIQLAEEIKVYIITGKYKPGEKLPSVREFALSFKINPNTVQKALVELENEKLIFTERTNGKFVTKDEVLINNIKSNLANQKINSFIVEMNNLGITKKEIITYFKKGDNI